MYINIRTLCCLWSFTLASSSCLQATWLPNSYESSSNETIFNMMSSLKDEGIQRVYVDVWNQGNVYFSSPTIQSIVPSSQGDDHLLWALNAGKMLNIDVFAWFEYGLMTSYGGLNNGFAQYANNQGWILGEYNNFYWMDPRNSNVLIFLSSIMNDAIIGYTNQGLKGVQLDDHFASPVSLGRNSTDMTNAASYIHSQISSSSIVLSLSPSTLSFAYNTYNVDWNLWGNLSYFDELIPQLYYTSFKSFKSEYDYTMQTLTDLSMNKWIASGIRVDGTGASTEWNEVNNMIEYCNTYNQGAIVWYTKGILETYPAEFQNIWD
mmetsp:Transcript_49142/g.63093  ORF Transcript_49142/g.63093 Transcript_49142/m.63093 type:complete len:320 (+) Transcript_49142:91-1050(+)